jgi:hypothetical protein
MAELPGSEDMDGFRGLELMKVSWHLFEHRHGIFRFAFNSRIDWKEEKRRQP